jgi:quercetin 2,3-dioxygenase
MNTQNRKTIPVSFHNAPAEPVQFFQVWLLPARQGSSPADAPPAAAPPSNTLTLACAPGGDGKSIKINQAVELFVDKLASEETISRSSGEPRHTRIEMLEGDLEINGQTLSSGESASVDEEKELRLASDKGAHFLLFDLC